MSDNVAFIGRKNEAVADSSPDSAFKAYLAVLETMDAAACIRLDLGQEYDALPVKPGWQYFIKDKLHYALRTQNKDFSLIRVLKEELQRP